MTFFQLGNLTIPSIWLAVLMAVGVTIGLYRLIWKRKIGAWFSDSVFYYILIWKFSYIVLNFSLFVDYPLGALYFNGGRVGHVVALAIVMTLLWYKAKKEAFSQELLPVMLLFYLTYQVAYTGLEQEWVLAVTQLLLATIFVILLRSHKIAMTLQLYTAFFVVQLLILSLEHRLLSVEGLTFSLLFLYSVLMKYWGNTASG